MTWLNCPNFLCPKWSNADFIGIGTGNNYLLRNGCSFAFHSMLCHCWFGNRKDIRPVKSWVLLYWWWWFDWSCARLMAALVTTISVILGVNKIAFCELVSLLCRFCGGCNTQGQQNPFCQPLDQPELLRQSNDGQRRPSHRHLCQATHSDRRRTLLWLQVHSLHSTCTVSLLWLILISSKYFSEIWTGSCLVHSSSSTS